MALRLEPVRRPTVKLLIPAAGVLALYTGALLGMFLASRIAASPPTLAALTLASSTAAALAAMMAVDAAIGAEASHVDILKTLGIMGAACLGVLLERKAVAWIGLTVPRSVENLVIWGAGVASIWKEEPGFAGWRSALSGLGRAAAGQGQRGVCSSQTHAASRKGGRGK